MLQCSSLILRQVIQVWQLTEAVNSEGPRNESGTSTHLECLEDTRIIPSSAWVCVCVHAELELLAFKSLRAL